MGFSLPFSTTSLAWLFGFVVFLCYRIVITSTNANKKKNMPPEVTGAWPVIGHLLLLGGPQPPHITLGNLADKYGPIFSFKLGVHQTVVISSWEMAKECFTTNDKAFANRPKVLAMDLLGYNFSMFGFSQYGPYWRQVRKISTLELLSNHRLEMLKHVRISEVRAFTKELYQFCADNKKQSADMKRWFSDVTMNIIFRAVVGKRFSEYPTKPQDEEMGRWRETMRSFFEWTGKFVVSDALPFLRWLDLGGCEKAMNKIMKELDRVMEKLLQEHKQKRVSGLIVKGEEDFMDLMIPILDDDKDLPRHKADIINKATNLALVSAAGDTTLVTLVWVISLLLNHPDALKKVQDELETQIGRERQVEESDMQNLVYLQAVIKETFRLYPAAPLSLPHESMEDCLVGGFRIPAGTRLLLNLSKLHRDPRVWPEPCVFKPERFLTTHKGIDVKGQNFELLPFGSGRRICPGISFALQVLPLTLASLLHGFEIETPSNEAVDMTESTGITNLKASPLDLLLTTRLPAYLY